MTRRIYHTDKIFCYYQKKIYVKNTCKEALLYLFNVVILFNQVFYPKLSFKLKVDPKTYNFKNQEEILKTGENFPKTFSHPL